MNTNNVRVYPLVIAGKIYVRGADGFRAAAATGIPGMTRLMHQPDGYYVRMPSGVRFHDKDGAPFVFIKRERERGFGFIVSWNESSEGIRYIYDASCPALAKLGLNASPPEADRLEQELAERILWETAPETPYTVFELLQRACAAEDDYERLLDDVYGAKRNPDTRYRHHDDASLKEAAAVFAAAGEAWRVANRFSQSPVQVREALASMVKPDIAQPATKCLVARLASVETASFAASGPREELAMILARLADDIDAREPGPARYDSVTLLDTNGLAVGEALFVDTAPDAPVDGKPLLIVPVRDFDRAVLAVKDVCTKLQSSIEDVHLLSQVDEAPMAHFYWRDLPVLEREWYRATGATPEALQASHDRVRQQLVARDGTNPDACFTRSYEGIRRAADSLGLDARLLGFADSARVGYFRDGQATEIASEITLSGKVITTVNGQRAKGTGYTADGEWQRDQLEFALSRLNHAVEAQPRVDVYAAAADLYTEPDGP